MSKKLRQASTIAVAATLIATLVSADGSGAAAREQTPEAAILEPAPQFVSQPLVQVVPATADSREPEAAESTQIESTELPVASLAQLVEAQPRDGELSRELTCLAGAVYFEAKSEPLAGQLAVGRVIVARSKSGRFPNSYCGVVYQPSQFSFIRGNAMPGIDRGSRQWRNAVAIAQIAHAAAWRSPVEGALYFHASRVSPGWRLARLGQIGNHVFYR